ncbi:MAG: hypothetical protein JW754_04445 [Candidatus Aenigmarchaeota archaeon]|nr:hypothetical protein [Candidatus Aenigmarchaeota archaeon]
MNDEVASLTPEVALAKGGRYIQEHCPRYRCVGDGWECTGESCCAYDFCDKNGELDRSRGKEALDFFRHDGIYL